MPESCRSRFSGARRRGLLREDHLQRDGGHAANDHEQHAEAGIFGFGNQLVQEMHAQRHEAGRDGRNHYPAALAKKCGVRLVVNCGRPDFGFGGHESGL
jgi:hypothetical protein